MDSNIHSAMQIPITAKDPRLSMLQSQHPLFWAVWASKSVHQRTKNNPQSRAQNFSVTCLDSANFCAGCLQELISEANGNSNKYCRESHTHTDFAVARCRTLSKHHDGSQRIALRAQKWLTRRVSTSSEGCREPKSCRGQANPTQPPF